MSKTFRGQNKVFLKKLAKFNRKGKNAKRERKSCLTEAALIHDRSVLTMDRAMKFRNQFLAR